MRTLPRLLLLSISTAGALLAQTVVGRADAVFTLSEALASGQTLRLISPNGSIAVTQTDGRTVELRAEKDARGRARNEDLGFIVSRTDAGLLVCAVYDDDDRCDMDRGYRQANNRDNWGRRQTAANFIVRIPAGIRVRAASGNGDITINGSGAETEANTGNGALRVTNTTGSVRANTGNGDVTVEDARGEVQVGTGNGVVRVSTSLGPVIARTGNGDIDVRMARLERAERMSFQTGSGRIRLTVPEDFGADLDASTGNGVIESELPVKVNGRLTSYRMRGTIGNGGEALNVSTGNGDIQIRKAMRM
jgi:hypothetical protein